MAAVSDTLTVNRGALQLFGYVSLTASPEFTTSTTKEDKSNKFNVQ